MRLNLRFIFHLILYINLLYLLQKNLLLLIEILWASLDLLKRYQFLKLIHCNRQLLKANQTFLFKVFLPDHLDN